jgi:hypothetical protein
MFSRSNVYEGTWEELAAYEPELRGRKLRLTVIEEAPASQPLHARRAFLKLPIEERRRLLAEQTERMVAYYERNTEWRDLQGGDIVEY